MLVNVNSESKKKCEEKTINFLVLVFVIFFIRINYVVFCHINKRKTAYIYLIF